MRREVLALVAASVLLASCQAPETGTWRDRPHAAPTPTPTIDLDRGRSEPVADPVYPDYGNPDLDVLHYDLDLTWSPKRRELTGAVTLMLRAVKRLEQVRLDFNDQLRVETVSVAGSAAEPTIRQDDLVVPLRRPAAPDSRLELTVRYSGTPEPVPMPSTRGDFGEGLGLRVEPDGALWTMQEPYGAATWYPVNDHPSDEALYDIAVTVPSGWAGVASGRFLGSQTRDGHSTYRWRSAAPVASYLTTLAVDRFRHHEDSADGVPLTYWVPEEYDGYQLAAMRRSPRILEWLVKRFGPYPFGSAGAVAVDSVSAMETQGMVTMGGKIAEDLPAPEARDRFTTVLVHEYAHQWFGDAVGPKDWRGIWLNEGFATYIEMLWVLDHSDISEADYVRWLRDRDRKSRAEAGPPGDYDPGKFAEGNVYVGPALMLHEIRGELGDEKFFRMCRAWVQRHRDTQQDRESFTTFVNDYTGRDLTPVIDRWLDSKTTPG